MVEQDQALQGTGTIIKATYTIEWPDDYGLGWMNIDNFKACLFGKACIGGEAAGKVSVEELEIT